MGGISRTVRHGNFLFDIGGHRFFSKAKEVVDLWHEILPDDFITRRRPSRIHYGGKFYSYPQSAFQALRDLGIFTSAVCMLSYAFDEAFPSPRSFHDCVRNRFGERLFQLFFKTYTEKVWGISCDDISADWAAQRIKGVDLRVAVCAARPKIELLIGIHVAVLPERVQWQRSTRRAAKPVVHSMLMIICFRASTTITSKRLMPIARFSRRLTPQIQMRLPLSEAAGCMPLVRSDTPSCARSICRVLPRR